MKKVVVLRTYHFNNENARRKVQPALDDNLNRFNNLFKDDLKRKGIELICIDMEISLERLISIQEVIKSHKIEKSEDLDSRKLDVIPSDLYRLEEMQYLHLAKMYDAIIYVDCDIIFNDNFLDFIVESLNHDSMVGSQIYIPSSSDNLLDNIDPANSMMKLSSNIITEYIQAINKLIGKEYDSAHMSKSIEEYTDKILNTTGFKWDSLGYELVSNFIKDGKVHQYTRYPVGVTNNSIRKSVDATGNWSYREQLSRAERIAKGKICGINTSFVGLGQIYENHIY